MRGQLSSRRLRWRALREDFELTAEEKRLALILDFDEEVLRLVKSEVQRPLEPFALLASPTDGGSVVLDSVDVLDGKGLPIMLAKEYAGMWEPDYLEIIHRIRLLLLPHGYMAFLTDAYGTMPCLAILKTLDQYEIIRVVETHGWDFDDKQWQPDELIAKLQEWQRLYDFNVIGAHSDNIKLEFTTLPYDLIAFAEEVHHLCWELQQVYKIDGYCEDPTENRRAAEHLAQIIRETHKIYLWWD